MRDSRPSEELGIEIEVAAAAAAFAATTATAQQYQRRQRRGGNEAERWATRKPHPVCCQGRKKPLQVQAVASWRGEVVHLSKEEEARPGLLPRGLRRRHAPSSSSSCRVSTALPFPNWRKLFSTRTTAAPPSLPLCRPRCRRPRPSPPSHLGPRQPSKTKRALRLFKRQVGIGALQTKYSA